MRVLLFSDNFGVPLALRYLPANCLVGIVGASIRPQYHSLLATHALASRVPFLAQPKRDDASYARFLTAILALSPELLLVNSYSMLLHKDVLEVASLGGVNVHGALLPKYRGANPIQWALINNETETGVTMHRLTPEFDAGDVIAQRRVAIQLPDTWLEVQARIAGATDDLLCEILPRVLEGRLEGRPQDEREARHYRRRTLEDGRIHWEQSVLRIYNLVRALVKPHPGAFYEVGGVRHLLDSYRSLAEITALKAELGALPLTYEGVSMAPVLDRTRPPDSVWFAMSLGDREDQVGMLGLCEINYRKRSAQLRVEGTSLATDMLPRAATWIAGYAVHELELSHLDHHANDALLLDKEALAETVDRLTHGDSRSIGSAARVAGL